MEIIFNKAVVVSITGKLRKKSPWYIRQRNGKYHAAYRSKFPSLYKIVQFRVFYQDLLELQKAHYISQIILTDQERRWLSNGSD